MNNDDIGNALKFDGLSVAERLTGASYKDDADTMKIGLGLHMMHNERKESLLRQSSDSFFNMSFSQQMNLFADIGFASVFEESFSGTDHTAETFVVLWHEDGLLATCGSYAGTRRNSAKVYYNYRHQSVGYPHGLTSSGHLNGEVWVGDHDAREGIRHNLEAMCREGSFISKWVERPFLWLLNYSETKGEYDYAAINERKIAALPEAVRKNITPQSELARAEGI